MNKILLSLLCLIALPVTGQNIQDYYVSKTEPDGKLYFIFPLTLFEQQGNGDLVLDITYKTGKDSATLNVTYNQKATMPADSVSFDAGTERTTATASKLYVETHKMPVWEHRYSLKLPFKKLSEFFATGTPTQMTIYSKGQKLVYTSKKASWRKHGKIVHTILYMAQQ